MENWRDYIFYEDEHLIVLNGDTRKVLPLMDADSVQLTATSPPYFGLRQYLDTEAEGKDAEIGSEQTPREFIEVMLAVFEDVKKVIHPSGSVVLNLGDSYAGSNKGVMADGSVVGGEKQRTNVGTMNGQITKGYIGEGFKPKDKMLIPHRTAIALCDEGGWWIRQEFPWTKRNPMPSSTTDRAGTATETMFHLAKRARYFWDETAVRVGSNWDASKTKYPDGWDRGEGSHSTIHRNGRSKGERNDATVPANWNDSSFTKGKTAGHQKGTMQSEESRGNRDRSNGNRNGEGGHLDDTPAGSRGFRNADLWYQSIEKPHGLVGVGDEIAGIDVNPAGFSGEFCTACDRYYHNAKDKKAIRVEKQDDGSERRFCLCGRADKWLSHFATYPEALVAPFIKAGTSEYGECAECKAPYERDSEKELMPTAKASFNSQYDERDAASDGNDQGSNRMRDGHKPGWFNDVVTIGWSKTCKCPTDEREPQTVLDPFGGAGTTAIAARRLGRKCILIELNPEYCKLIVARYKREFEDQDAVQASPAAENYAMPLFVSTNAETA